MFKYHMVPGRRTSYALHDGDRLYTLHGYPVNVTKDASGSKSFTIQADKYKTTAYIIDLN